jgi:sporulation protein YlmC with PRC-barrel domain
MLSRNPIGLTRSGAKALPTSGLALLVLGATLAFLLITAMPHSALSQAAVSLVKVDIAVVNKGYRVNKLTGESVVNEKNEKIGTLDDIVIARDKSLFSVLQVGGFLGLGSRLVVVPYDSLRIDDTGKRIELPGATKDQLMNLVEFKYAS